ncbi:MAG: hypothetical protein Q8K07_18225, partial [Methylicorpusculum sp.]|uniref:hypothetical protein n=1 Tax=Methylicorpusculum sp. TaxID=2713644 RepID=UPI00272F78B3
MKEKKGWGKLFEDVGSKDAAVKPAWKGLRRSSKGFSQPEMMPKRSNRELLLFDIKNSKHRINNTLFMKLKSVFLLILPRIPVLLLSLMLSAPLSWFASDFLKVDGADIRDNYGVGNNVHLYGTNLGGWMGHE